MLQAIPVFENLIKNYKLCQVIIKFAFPTCVKLKQYPEGFFFERLFRDFLTFTLLAKAFQQTKQY